MVFIVMRGVVLVFVYITIVVCVHVFLSLNNIVVNNHQCYETSSHAFNSKHDDSIDKNNINSPHTVT